MGRARAGDRLTPPKPAKPSASNCFKRQAGQATHHLIHLLADARQTGVLQRRFGGALTVRAGHIAIATREAVTGDDLATLDREVLARFRAEAQQAIERHRGRVDDAALADAMDRYTRQRAREKLGLIRVGSA